TYNRILKPAMRAAGIKDGGFHRFRHTCGTHLYRNGAQDVQVQMWLGHHDPGFTARTYVHLEPRDLPDPAMFDDLTSASACPGELVAGDAQSLPRRVASTSQ